MYKISMLHTKSHTLNNKKWPYLYEFLETTSQARFIIQIYSYILKQLVDNN